MSGVRERNDRSRRPRLLSLFYGAARPVDRSPDRDDEQIKKNYDYVTRKGKTLYAETYCSGLNEERALMSGQATSIFDDQGDPDWRHRIDKEHYRTPNGWKGALQDSVQRYEPGHGWFFRRSLGTRT